MKKAIILCIAIFLSLSMVLAEIVCDDGKCDSAVGETCDNSPKDCCANRLIRFFKDSVIQGQTYQKGSEARFVVTPGVMDDCESLLRIGAIEIVGIEEGFSVKCGNGVCGIGECGSCPQDCNPSYCPEVQGDGKCDPGISENCDNSPEDCCVVDPENETQETAENQKTNVQNYTVEKNDSSVFAETAGQSEKTTKSNVNLTVQAPTTVNANTITEDASIQQNVQNKSAGASKAIDILNNEIISVMLNRMALLFKHTFDKFLLLTKIA